MSRHPQRYRKIREVSRGTPLRVGLTDLGGVVEYFERAGMGFFGDGQDRDTFVKRDDLWDSRLRCRVPMWAWEVYVINVDETCLIPVRNWLRCMEIR